MNILSLFDGMSCGREALYRISVDVDKYYASEIDKHAIKISGNNWGDVIQLGDVQKLNDPEIFKSIDLLIGGSPCQGFSLAGKMLNFNDPRSKLFFEYVRVLNEIRKHNPEVKFLLENVMMVKRWQDVITECLGVKPMIINSNLVSAQNRKRLYWTNIEGVTQPDDRKIFLDSAVEHDVLPYTLTRRRTEECKQLRKTMSKKLGKDYSPKGMKEYVRRTDGKANCITAKINEEQHLLPLRESDGKTFRLQTPLEWERLQTLPDNYTAGVSDTQRYKMLGNGWTIDVISHILSFLYI